VCLGPKEGGGPAGVPAGGSRGLLLLGCRRQLHRAGVLSSALKVLLAHIRAIAFDIARECLDRTTPRGRSLHMHVFSRQQPRLTTLMAHKFGVAR
jgi:hypothetical protein